VTRTEIFYSKIIAGLIILSGGGGFAAGWLCRLDSGAGKCSGAF